MVLPEYDVNIQARPLTVNKEALMEPYAAIIILDCESKPQELNNYNYPAELTFKWKPDTCGDVTLQILFEDFTLTKMYKGPKGFASFLEDFRDGTRTFTLADFPDNADALKNLEVNRIRVTYVIDNSLPIRKLLDKEDFKAPENITECHGS